MIWRSRSAHSLRTLCLWPFQTLVTRPETGPMAPELQILVTVKLAPWSPNKSGQLTNCVGGFLCRLLGRWKIVCYLFLVSLPAEVLHPWCSDALEFTFGGLLAVQVIFVHNWFKAPLDRKRNSTLPSHLPKLPPQAMNASLLPTRVLSLRHPAHSPSALQKILKMFADKTTAVKSWPRTAVRCK